MFFLKLFLFILIVIILLFVVCLIKTYLTPSKQTSYEPSKDEKRSLAYAKKLQKLIKIETVSHKGIAEIEKFRKLHKVLESLYPNVFKTCEKIEIDGNIMVKWKGKNKKLDPIILISHIDVVDASGDWKFPPFSGTIDNGRIYGRGASDIKNDVCAFYQAVEELILEGYKPECDVYLGSSCTEEVSGNGAPKLVEWFKKHHIHLYMLSDEGGAISEDPVPFVKGHFAAIGVFEKGYGDIEFIAKSTGGHSSTPGKNTPIPRLAKFINDIEKHDPFTAQLGQANQNMFTSLAPYCENFWYKLILSNLWLFKPVLTKVVPIISPMAGAMLKTTIAFTMQSGSNGYNVLPEKATVVANCRFIPHQDADDSIELLKKLAEEYGLETRVITKVPSSKSLDLQSEQYKMTVKTINKVFPGVGIMPYVVTGGTDSRFFDPVCDHCVRFSPFNLTSQQLDAMHGIDENININTLPLAVDYYKEIIKIQETRI